MKLTAGINKSCGGADKVCGAGGGGCIAFFCEDGRTSDVENALAAARANPREASTDRLFATYDKIYEDFQNRRELFTDIEAAINPVRQSIQARAR